MVHEPVSHGTDTAHFCSVVIVVSACQDRVLICVVVVVIGGGGGGGGGGPPLKWACLEVSRVCYDVNSVHVGERGRVMSS